MEPDRLKRVVAHSTPASAWQGHAPGGHVEINLNDGFALREKG